MKKLTSIILIAASLFSLLIPMAVSAEDHENSEYEKGLLRAISFLGDDPFAEDEVLTRGEFCGMVNKLFKYESYSDGDMTFKDIDSTHPYYDAIAALWANGAINGITKYSVAPNKPITLEEAGTILVSALGYSKYIDEGLTSYSSKASALGLYDGIKGARSGGLTEEQAITLMYNTLFAPIVYYMPDGESISYVTDKNTLMMNHVYDMYEIKGVVTENSLTSLYGLSTIQENEIKIDTTVYSLADQSVCDLLGYAVKAYVVENDDDDDVVIYAYTDKKYTNELEINSEDIEDAVKTQIKYDDGTKVRTAKLSKAADVIYNGIGLDSYDNTTLRPTCGVLKLIDNDGDEVYDVVMITAYQFYMVRSASMSDDEIYIYDVDGNTLKIDRGDVDCEVHVWVNDDEKDFSAITNGTALLAVDSGTRDKTRLMNFHILTEKVTGSLSSLTDEKLTVNGTSYEISPLLDKTAARECLSKDVSCYIDIFGKAVYLKIEAAGNYGFLLKAYLLDDDETVQVKILDTNNEWQKYNLKERVRNNANSVEATDMLNLIKGKEVVRYTLNSEGLINRLDLAMYEEDASGEVDRQRDATMRDAGYFRKSFSYKQRQFAHEVKGLFDGPGYSRWVECFFPSSGLPILVRPKADDEVNEDTVLFYGVSYFQTDWSYYTEVYDLTADNLASLVVVFGSSEVSISASDNLLIAESIEDELDEDDMLETKLYAWYKGGLNGFKGTKDNSFEYKSKSGVKVQKGDIFQVAKNFSGEVEYLDTLTFRIDSDPSKYFTDKSSVASTTAAAYGPRQIAVGRVSVVNGDLLRLTVKDGNYINGKLRDATYYYVYDGSNKKQSITKGTRADIKVGDIAVMRLYYGRLTEVFIYKNI